MKIQGRVRVIIPAAIPLIAAAVAVAVEPYITALARWRQATLPFFVCILLASLLHPRIRDFLMTTLCYGVAFLAVRDILQGPQVYRNPVFNTGIAYHLRPFILSLVALQAAAAGVIETVQPGAVWARRAYFGAAAIYATGLGIANWTGSGQSVLLLVTGLTALMGCIFADRIMVIGERDLVETAANDELAQTQREQEHRKALLAKEWHDDAAIAEGKDYEGGITAS